MPTKAKGGGPSTGANMLAAAVGAIILLVVILAILNMTGVINLSKRSRKAKPPATSSDKSKHKAKGVDRRADEEAPVATPAPVEPVAKKVRIEQPLPQAPKKQATHSLGGKSFFDSQFAPLDSAQFDKQFGSQNTKLSRTALSSQLKSDALMPQFSSDRQPTRQTGMPLDMVYTELRAENSPPAAKKPMETIPFGGSEFYEMRRAQIQGKWRDDFA